MKKIKEKRVENPGKSKQKMSKNREKMQGKNIKKIVLNKK